MLASGDSSQRMVDHMVEMLAHQLLACLTELLAICTSPTVKVRLLQIQQVDNLAR